MALTEEEKKKIAEEEAYRSEVRHQLNQPPISPKPQKKKGMGCATIFVILIIVFVYLVGSSGNKSSNTTSSSENTPKTKGTFLAYVNFTGSQFIISNLDPYTCENARMQVNNDYSLEGYTLESSLTAATKSGEVPVYKVGAAQFTKDDGTRFNPFSTKPMNFFIECRGNNELTSAYWAGSFK